MVEAELAGLAAECACWRGLGISDQVRMARPEFPQGLKPAVLLLDLMYGLKPVPFT